MKSRFRYWAYFLAFLALGFSVILIMELTGNILNPTMPIGFFLVFTQELTTENPQPSTDR